MWTVTCRGDFLLSAGPQGRQAADRLHRFIFLEKLWGSLWRVFSSLAFLHPSPRPRWLWQEGPSTVLGEHQGVAFRSLS